MDDGQITFSCRDSTSTDLNTCRSNRMEHKTIATSGPAAELEIWNTLSGWSMNGPGSEVQLQPQCLVDRRSDARQRI